MITNSTISILQHHHHRIDEPTAINDLEPTRYDSSGAALFIIVVLSWYSIGIVCMLGMQIQARAETIEDCARRRGKLFIRNLRDQTQTKQILEELVDKKKRDKLWDIYLGKTDNNKDKLNRAEFRRIKNIEKQLAVINRNRMIMNETLITPIIHHSIHRSSSDSRCASVRDLSSIENHSRRRRRPSLDQQIIERWKSIADHSKPMEQLPWTIKKVLIRRHFRRTCKNSPRTFEQNKAFINDSSSSHEYIDMESNEDEQCHLLPTRNHIRNNSCPTNERLNPYITYFHLPINENLESNIQDFPLVAIKSDHHIIQMNHNESQC